MLTSLACVTGLLQTVAAVNGGASGNKPFNYTAGSPGSTMGGTPKYALKSSAYQYTGMGAAESNIDFAPDGSLIYTPALTTAGIGYATSKDAGQTWSQVLPGSMQRPQPVFRQFQNRYFMWSTKGPGLAFQFSDDQGQTFSPPLDGGNFDPMIQDWAKMVSGKPVRSQLSNGATEILYFSAPSLISTPIPIQPLGPIQQYIMKSTDRGSTWNVTKGMPTLQPLLSGGACSGLLPSLAGQELIIWGDGFVMKNGTVVYGLRRCQKLSLAFSDDEGDSWRLVDVPGSSLPPFMVGDLTYLLNGNVLVPEPISMDVNGNFYAIWVDPNYVLQFSRSTNSGATWSSPVEIGAPAKGMNKTMAYLPTLRQHPTTANRAVLAYYGSQDGGAHYNGFIAETGNINSAKPVFSSIIGNNLAQPLQANDNGMWDQGYGDPLYDLIEFMDVRYAPANSGFGQDNIVTAFTRSMCSAQSQPPEFYPRDSCVPGWDYDARGMSRWQGVVLSANH